MHTNLRKGSGLIMKKTLVALSVLAAAGSVNAAEIYNNDGVTVNVNGSAEVQYYQDYEADGTDVSQEIRIDDAQLNTRVSVAVTEELSAVAGLDLTFESDDSDNKGTDQTDGAFVGFAHSTLGTITFGRQYLITDDSGIGTDFEVGYGQYGQDQTVSNDAIKYVYDNGQFYFGLSHDLDEGDSTSANDPNSTDGRIGVRFGGLDARLYVFSGESVALGKDSKGNTLAAGDEDSYNLEMVYTFSDAWQMTASYGNVDREIADVKKVDEDIFEITGSYTLEKNTFSLGYVYNDDDTLDVTSNNIYGTVVHKFNPNVRAYVEAGYVDVDYENAADPDYDLAYTVGMEVKF